MKGDGCVGRGWGQIRHWGGHGSVGRATEGYHEMSDHHGQAGLGCPRDGTGMLLHTATPGANLPRLCPERSEAQISRQIPNCGAQFGLEAGGSALPAAGPSPP